MSDAHTPTCQTDTALDEVLSDLIRAVDMDLAAIRTAPVARQVEFVSTSSYVDEVLFTATKLSPAREAYLLHRAAEAAGLVNVQRAAWRVYELYREQEARTTLEPG